MKQMQRNNQGAVLIIVAFGMILFFSVAAIVIDMGRVYTEVNRLQEASEAAAMAGCQELARMASAGIEIGASEEADVKAAAVRFGERNNITVNPDDIVVTGDRVYIHVTQTVEYTFARVLGFESKEVAGNAVAKVSSDGSTSLVNKERYNIMPWGISFDVPDEPYNLKTGLLTTSPIADFTPGQEYILRLGDGPQAGGIYYPEGTQVLIPMGGSEAAGWDQWNIGFKRAYGLVYWLAGMNIKVKWLLDYRGGSFMFDMDADVMRALGAMPLSGGGEFGSAGIFLDPNYFQWVKYEIYADGTTLSDQAAAMIVLDRVPRVGVYTPTVDTIQRLLFDARIPYGTVYEPDALAGGLANFDWLYIHHEDFTGGTAVDAGVPTIAITDEIGNTVEGTAGGVVKARGSGFKIGTVGIDNIIVWFHNTQLNMTDTVAYAADVVHPDHMQVDADDNGNFEVSFIVPNLPNGTYKVYAQVGAAFTNFPEYTIVGSSINPLITVTDSVGIALQGPYGGTVTVEGNGFGPNSNNIVVKFNNTNQSCTTTAKYADDGITADGYILATPGGSFEVTFTTPNVYSDGTYSVQAYVDVASSNLVQYNILNYWNPRITVTDWIGDPYSGPSGGWVLVKGSDYRPLQAGIELKFNNDAINVWNYNDYAGDQVIGWTDITSNANGNWDVVFPAPALGTGLYTIKTEHTDAYTTAVILSNVIDYDLLDPDNMTAEIYLSDGEGDVLAGVAGGTITVDGNYFFNSNADDVDIWIFSTPQQLTCLDTAKYGDDGVSVDGLTITPNGDGNFQVTFTMPILDFGTHEVKASYWDDVQNTRLWTAPVVYTVAESARELVIIDDQLPFNSGIAGVTLTVRGSGFAPNSPNLLLKYGGANVLELQNTPFYAGDNVASGKIFTDNQGKFEVTIRTPYWPEGSYPLQITAPAGSETPEYPYILNLAEDFWTSRQADFSNEDNAFTLADTIYLKALHTRVNTGMMVRNEAVLTCTYHGTHRVTVPMSFIGDYMFSGSLVWASLPDAHNGDWAVQFDLEDAMGVSYQPQTTVHVTGVANVVEGAIVSRNADFSTADVPLGANDTIYFKIQTPSVDYSLMSKQYFQVVCRSEFGSGGWDAATHNTGKVNLANNWDGVWSASYAFPMTGQHLGDYRVKQRVVDTLGRSYEDIRDVVFFPDGNQYTLVSNNANYENETNDFFREGAYHLRTFKRGVNHLDMNQKQYMFKKHKVGNDPVTDLMELNNEGNLIFNVTENLANYVSQTSYFAIEVFTYLKDNNNQTFNDSKYCTLRNTASSNPLFMMGDLMHREGVDAGLAWLLGSAARSLATALHEDAPMRLRQVSVGSGGIFVDGVRDELSPKPGDNQRSAPVYVFDWLKPEQGADELQAETRKLLAAWHAAPQAPPPAPVHVEDFWAKLRKAILPTPAYAALYSGKYEVAHIIRNWVLNGGYLFASCTASESLDKVLSKEIDGTFSGYNYTFAFQNFGTGNINDADSGNFMLQDMTATTDPYARSLSIVQNHQGTIGGFTGTTTSYNRTFIKPTTGPGGEPVYQCGIIDLDSAKYLAAKYGEGWYSFLGGHDPNTLEVYRLVLNNILMGSLSSTIPVSQNINYVNLDMDSTEEAASDDGEKGNESEYLNNIRYGYPPGLMGDIVTSWPGDMDAPYVQTLPYNIAEQTLVAVNYLVSHDMDRAEAGEVHSWRTPEYASSRYVLVPVVSAFNTDGSPTFSQPQNQVAPIPTNIYEVKGRDKLRIRGLALFYLSSTAGLSSGDSDFAETGSQKPGEVRGKFIGYLK